MNVGWPANPRWNVDQSTSLYFSIFFSLFPFPTSAAGRHYSARLLLVQCKINIWLPVVVKNLWCKLIPRFILTLCTRTRLLLAIFLNTNFSLFDSRKLENHLLFYFIVFIRLMTLRQHISHLLLFYNTSRGDIKYNSNYKNDS